MNRRAVLVSAVVLVLLATGTEAAKKKAKKSKVTEKLEARCVPGERNTFASE